MLRAYDMSLAGNLKEQGGWVDDFVFSKWLYGKCMCRGHSQGKWEKEKTLRL